jgi:DNA polymerase III delta prime subunit
MFAIFRSWIGRLLGQPALVVNAAHRGVAIGGNNTGTIITGDYPLITIVNGTPEQVSDECLHERLVTIAGEVVRGVSVTRLIADTIVPVNLVERRKSASASNGEDTEYVQTPISPEHLAGLVANGRNVILSGEGGIGKTTTVLQLAKTLLDEHATERVPIFVDAPAWASSNMSPFQYIASLPVFEAAEMTATKLAKYAAQNKLTLFIDGWNEIAFSSMEACSNRMRSFFTAAPGVNIVLTTRNENQRPDFASPLQVIVTGIDWHNQQNYIRAELPTSEASALINQLSVQHRLRHATRNPLILRGVVELRTEVSSIANAFIIYRAIVKAYEAESSRQAALNAAPMYGLHTSYLEAIAWKLNFDGAIALEVSDARSIIAAEVRALQANNQISTLVEPADVLQELCDHHLLFQEQGLVRFAHQRFQEYFSAFRYLSLLGITQGAAPTADLIEPLNWPFWEDSLLLVAGQLSTEPTASTARLTLMRAAVIVDLHFACALVAASKFHRQDGAPVFDELVSAVNTLVHSTNTDVMDFALSCMIDSTLPDFSNELWHHLEHEDRQHRLNFHRLGQNPVSIHQLGTNASARIDGWNVDRRVEFMHEVARNPDNWDFLVKYAFHAEDDALRMAAISAIRWEYPASDVALQAWLRATDSVKLNDGLLGLLEEDLLEADESARAELRRLRDASPDGIGDSLALRFPTFLRPPSAEYLIQRLTEDGPTYLNETILALLDIAAPQRVTELAIERALSTSYLPDWAAERIRNLDTEARTNLFGRVLDDLLADPHARNARGVLAELANQEEVRTILRDFLTLRSTFFADRRNFSEMDRYFVLQSLLHHLNGSQLVAACIQEASANDERIREEIVDLIRHRADTTYDDSTRAAWVPNVDEVDAMISALLDDASSNHLACMLADIASRVDPERYQELTLNCCRRELDEWSDFRIAIDRWAESGGMGSRPINPQDGILLSRVLVRWGCNALSGLQQMIDHPEADNFVFPAIATILQQPWRSRLTSTRSNERFDGANMASMCNEVDCAMRQPTPELQERTDEVVLKLTEQLASALRILKQPTTADSIQKRLASRIDVLVLALARIPSTLAAAPVLEAIVGGYVSDSTATETMEALLIQGLVLEDQRPAARLCAIWEGMAGIRWQDESQLYRFRKLSQVILRLPHALLVNPATHYLDKWIAASNNYEVARHLAASRSSESFGMLCHMLKESNVDSRFGESVAHNIVAALSPSTTSQFVEVIRDGSFFGSQPHGWYMDNVVASLYSKIGGSPEALASILDACVRNNSYASITLACLLLAQVHASDTETFEIAVRTITPDNMTLDVSALLQFKRLFSRKQPLAGDTYQILSLASNRLRQHFFSIARSECRFSNAAKSLLCKVEADRRDGDRPVNEPRHPDLGSGSKLADVLAS